MDNKEFGRKMEVRTKTFAIGIIKYSSLLQLTAEGKVIRNQLTKSGTSIGANYREANNSRSGPDFQNKIKICAGEASETAYWLEIISELDWIDPLKTNELLNECRELQSIFTKVSSTLKAKALK